MEVAVPTTVVVVVDMKIKRLVTPGEVITFSIGTGGTGNSSSAEATNGSATTFPAGAGWPDHSAGGGSSGTNGLGGAIVLLIHRQLCSCEEEGSMGIPKR
ncbi:MAG: hypothetical protein IPK46_12760 [Saprospiraceae bacterium]|nr:hypothetical protein [Saprospiraceae bacterium]